MSPLPSSEYEDQSASPSIHSSQLQTPLLRSGKTLSATLLERSFASPDGALPDMAMAQLEPLPLGDTPRVAAAAPIEISSIGRDVPASSSASQPHSDSPGPSARLMFEDEEGADDGDSRDMEEDHDDHVEDEEEEDEGEDEDEEDQETPLSPDLDDRHDVQHNVQPDDLDEEDEAEEDHDSEASSIERESPQLEEQHDVDMQGMPAMAALSHDLGDSELSAHASDDENTPPRDRSSPLPHGSDSPVALPTEPAVVPDDGGNVDELQVDDCLFSLEPSLDSASKDIHAEAKVEREPELDPEPELDEVESKVEPDTETEQPTFSSSSTRISRCPSTPRVPANVVRRLAPLPRHPQQHPRSQNKTDKVNTKKNAPLSQPSFLGQLRSFVSSTWKSLGLF
jgi:hypothetical protein